MQVRLLKPVSRIPTFRDGEASEDDVSVFWEMKVVEREARIPVDSLRLQSSHLIFRISCLLAATKVLQSQHKSACF